jgi:chemotaxis protein histidine kinase CheA
VQATKQQQIVVYFIEEAREHLDTIEQCLIDLQATMDDTERLNELFRAAHSVKGGAAMLGFEAIQKVGHHLEDAFKLLKENPVRVDQPLENLFLQAFDVLKHLVTELQSPYGLQSHEVAQVMQTAAPMFVELEAYLNQLISGKPPSREVKASPAKVVANLPAVMNVALKQMLELFKQGDTLAGRQKLVGLCGKMTQLHSGVQWQQLMQVAGKAILPDSARGEAAIAASPSSYKILAPLLIKELKQAGDLLIAGRVEDIVPSQNLQQLAKPSAPVSTVTPLRPADRLNSPASSTPGGAAGVRLTPASPVPANPEAAPTAAKGGKVQQIMIPVEPRAAARVLLEKFNRNQLIELAEYLMKAIQ